ncbi:MAG: threonine--tRNA ligase [Candidatus Pacebacteria bacterium]|nr:threonine--tRNA ligase [Candidatus Paceibacterota bacterium]
MEENDHKKIGPELELFYIDQTVGKGLPMFLPKGAIIKRELENFVIEEETKRGYLHVETPDLARLELYEKSGHYPHYKDSMYAPIEIDDEKFMLRPMTCPHHFQMFLSRPHSYREAPMRIAELAQLYRYEQSGELMGLIRTRTFCLADAHIICASEEQAAQEISGALDLIEHANGVFGLKLGTDYRYRLSLGDRTNTEKYYKNDEAWEKGESLLRELMQKRGCEFEEAKDEAAFYGPKIDVQMKNVNGKEDTAFTVQYDFCMPDRFDLTYIGEDGKPKRAFVVHRSSIGSLGRTMAFLIEKYGGAFPLWLSPVQAQIIPIAEPHQAFAKEVQATLRAAGIRADIDLSKESLGRKIREAKTQKIPYTLVIGDAEVSAQTASLEGREGKIGALSVEDIASKLKEEIKARA